MSRSRCGLLRFQWLIERLQSSQLAGGPVCHSEFLQTLTCLNTLNPIAHHILSSCSKIFPCSTCSLSSFIFLCCDVCQAVSFYFARSFPVSIARSGFSWHFRTTNDKCMKASQLSCLNSAMPLPFGITETVDSSGFRIPILCRS